MSLERFWFHGLTRTFVKTNKEASTELCSVLKHAGRSREAVEPEGSLGGNTRRNPF